MPSRGMGLRYGSMEADERALEGHAARTRRGQRWSDILISGSFERGKKKNLCSDGSAGLSLKSELNLQRKKTLAATTRYELAADSPRILCRRGPPRSRGAPGLGLRSPPWRHGIQLPRLPGCLMRKLRTTESSDLSRTSPIQRLTRPRGGRYFKYRPPPVRTVHLWKASLAARHAAEARWRAAPRAWGVGCLSNVPGQYRPLLVVARTPPLLRIAFCRRAPAPG